MNKPVSRTTRREEAEALRALFSGRGHALLGNPKNRYVAFEVRTEGRSIFTLYTSGKLVSTVREGDGEGLLLEAELAELLGEPPAGASGGGATRASAPGVSRGTREGLLWLGGVDETGTGELLGSAIVGGALLPPQLGDAVDAVAGSVETKTSRAASGWERLGEKLSALVADGLIVTALPIPNRLFDVYSKNQLLDLAYVRLVGDLLAAAGVTDLAGVELVLDDYRVGALLKRAMEAWCERGATVLLETRADDAHLAVRTASVFARAARSREMQGLHADVDDGPIGTGNAGHPETLRWLQRRARRRDGWPSFVKASFKTVRELDGLQPVTKRRPPAPDTLLDAGSAEAFVAGRMDSTRAEVGCGDGFTSRLVVDPRGRHRQPDGVCPALDLLPLLFGGIVLDLDELPLETLDELLDREHGLLSGWRVLLGPGRDADDPVFLALARAHRAGIVHLLPTDVEDPVERAGRRCAVRLTDRDDEHGFSLRLAR